VSEERTITISWQDPMATAAAASGRTGLEHLEAMVRGELPPPPIGVLMRMEPVILGYGRAVFAGDPGEEHYNPIGTVHGGYAATLLDSAMGCAVQTTLPTGAAYTTLEIKINYVRPIVANTGRVLAEARTVHRGRTVATAEGQLRAEESGKLLAHGTSTCQVFTPEAPDANGSSPG
jgi:uncharacterized protein (TIGR00369 family)